MSLLLLPTWAWFYYLHELGSTTYMSLLLLPTWAWFYYLHELGSTTDMSTVILLGALYWEFQTSLISKLSSIIISSFHWYRLLHVGNVSFNFSALWISPHKHQVDRANFISSTTGSVQRAMRYKARILSKIAVIGVMWEFNRYNTGKILKYILF